MYNVYRYVGGERGERKTNVQHIVFTCTTRTHRTMQDDIFFYHELRNISGNINYFVLYDVFCTRLLSPSVLRYCDSCVSTFDFEIVHGRF